MFYERLESFVVRWTWRSLPKGKTLLFTRGLIKARVVPVTTGNGGMLQVSPLV